MLSPKELEEIAEALQVNKLHASRSDIEVACVKAYFDSLADDDDVPPDDIRTELYRVTTYCIEYCNKLRKAENSEIHQRQKENKKNNVLDAPFEADVPYLRCPSELTPVQIAHAIIRTYHVCRIPCAGEAGEEDHDLLAIYQESGTKAGLYTYSDTMVEETIGKFKLDAAAKESAEVIRCLRRLAPREERCEDKDLLVVGNCIFNFKTKEPLPFTPEKVFLSKSSVNYNPNAQNPVIHNEKDGSVWDFDSWLQEVMPDPEIRELLWQVMGAVIRPNVPWGKAVFLSGDKGNNGKGTICRLLRNLCGDGNWASIPLENFGKDFMLEKLIGATANIVDENDVGGYLERAADFKAAVTGDPIQINRKNRRPVEYAFKGLTVQCLNDKPRVQDSSDSFYRRVLIIPFGKTFIGRERKYIKYDYMGRQEVLEYVLNRVLNMDYEELMEPAACRQALGMYRISNDPVRQWWDEVFDRFTWDLLPWKFLYQCYVNWFRASNPSGRVQSRNSFIDKMRAIAEQDTIWEYPGRGPDGKDIQFSAGGRIKGNEELAMDYYLPNCDVRYKESYRLGLEANWLGDQNRPKKHRGLVRRQTSPGQSAASGINTAD